MLKQNKSIDGSLKKPMDRVGVEMRLRIERMINSANLKVPKQGKLIFDFNMLLLAAAADANVFYFRRLRSRRRTGDRYSSPTEIWVAGGEEDRDRELAGKVGKRLSRRSSWCCLAVQLSLELSGCDGGC